jgi:hypothetical protein
LFGPALLAFVSLVEGENCPAPVDVELRVRTILQLSPEQQLSEGFAVERREAGLYVALRRADSTLIGERTLPTSGSCDELAQAAAVVLSAWLTDVHPDFAGVLPAREPEPEPPVAVETPPVAPPPASPPPPPPPPPARPVAKAQPAPPAEPDSSWRLLLGIGGDWAGGGLAPAALVGADYGTDGSGFALSARTMIIGPRQEPLGPGRVSWWRWPLALGAGARIEGKTLSFALSAGPAAAWLRLTGESFDRTSTQNAVSWGGFLDAVVTGRGPTLRPFGALNAQIYPAPAKAYVDASTPLEWQLPRLSLTLFVGIRFWP